MLLMAAVLAVKDADVAAADTVIDAGMASVELEFERVIVAPPVGAAPESVTVQVAEEFGPRLVGLHVREETTTDDTEAGLSSAICIVQPSLADPVAA